MASTIGSKWITDLKALTALPAPDELEKRTCASVRAMAQNGYDDDLLALVARYNADQQAANNPGHPLWKSAGWMAVTFSSINWAEAGAHGIRWVAGITSHGVNPDGGHAYDANDYANQAWCTGGGVDMAHSLGIQVLGWQWNQGIRPEDEAYIAGEHVSGLRLDGYIANGEEAWKGNDQPERWANRFKFALGVKGKSGIPVAWSVLGAATPGNVFPFDYKAFLTRGWDILPQAYPQESGEYNLDNVIRHSRDAGIPDDRWHATIADYDPVRSGAFKPTMSEWQQYLARYRNEGMRGVSLYSHDWSKSEIQALAPYLGA